MGQSKSQFLTPCRVGAGEWSGFWFMLSFAQMLISHLQATENNKTKDMRGFYPGHLHLGSPGRHRDAKGRGAFVCAKEVSGKGGWKEHWWNHLGPQEQGFGSEIKVNNLMELSTRNIIGEFRLVLQMFVPVVVQVTGCLLCLDSGFGRTLAAWSAFAACSHRKGFFTRSGSISHVGDVGVE